MAIIAPELGGIFDSAVKRKANKTGKLRTGFAKAKAARVAAGSAEVMVKITGFGKGAGHIEAHVKYISRHGKVELENDRGDIISGKEEIKELFSEWTKDFADGKRRKEQRDAVHVFFSMPPGTDPEAVRGSVRDFLTERFSHNHEYVFALHTDQPHPHVHAAIKIKGFDGKSMRQNREDLQSWRESFAANLRARGVDAEATPRTVRGVTKRAEKAVIRHIEQGDKTHPPRVPKVKASRIKEAAQELVAERTGATTVERAWEPKIKAAQENTRARWIEAAKALESGLKGISLTGHLKHERPNYERPLSEHSSTHRHASGLYQSDVAQAQGRESAVTVAGMRNMPSVDVVYHRRSPEMLLQSHASDRVGHGKAADHGLRRPRLGLDRVDGATAKGAGKGNELGAVDNQSLAQSIKSFVAAMPPVKTLHQETKQGLERQFARSKDLGVTAPPNPAPARNAPTPDKTRDQDLDR